MPKHVLPDPFVRIRHKRRRGAHDMKYMDKKRIILGSFFLGLGLFYLYQTYSFKLSFPLEEGTLHPMSLPRFLLYTWSFLSVLYIIIPRKPMDLKDLLPELPRLGLMVTSIVLFILIIPHLGFLISGTLLLISIFWIIEYRSVFSLIIAISSIIAIYLLFTYAMQIPLPSNTIF